MIDVVSGPTTRPVTIAEAKTWCRISGNDEDALLEMLINSACEEVEHLTMLALTTRTIAEYFDVLELPIMLEVAPVTAVASIQYRDTTDGTYQTWNSANYKVDLVSKPARIAIAPNGVLPTMGDYQNAIKVNYTAGETDVQTISRAKQAILLLVAMAYQNREDGETNESNNPRQRASLSLIRQISPQKI